MRFNDAVIGLVLIVFAIAEIAYTQTFPRLYGQDYGPDLFPILIGVGLIVCGVILVAQGIAARGTSPAMLLGDWAQDRRKLTNLFLLIASVLIYILFSTAIGFIPLSLLILTVLMIRLGTSAMLSVAVAVAATFFIHTMFAKLLLVPLPWGVLLPIAW
ncbi:MAG: tripartite tricarboxylate transporter TctB family protein [Paracoccaceae bacterium]